MTRIGRLIAMETATTVLTLGAVFAGAAFIYGFAGFAFGLISVSLLSLLPMNLEWGAAAVTLQSLVLASYFAYKARIENPVRWDLLGVLLISGAIAMPLGYWGLEHFGDDPRFRLALGVVVLGFGVHGLLARPIAGGGRLHRGWGVPLGAMGGAIGGAMVSGGPPLIYYLYNQGDDARTMKSTVIILFLILGSERLILTGVQGSVLSLKLIVITALLMPVSLAMLALGHRLSHRASALAFRRYTFGMLVLIGGVGILRSALVLV